MLRLTGVLGQATDPEISERLHRLTHNGAVEVIELDRDDLARRRLRAATDKGTECAIALPRDERLANGAVLMLEDDRAVVVRMKEEQWLAVAPEDAAAALELGYLAGNMHWRARFAGPLLKIALEGEEAAYLARLRPLLDSGRARKVEDG